MGGVEECGRAGGVWWEGRRSVGGWRSMGGLEECSGRVEECGGIGVWEGVRHVGGVEVCGTMLETGQ